VVIIDAIKDWLRDPVRGEWLIVVDGLGKVANKMEEYIRNFIPNCDHGHVIITARHGNATDHLNARIDIGPMTDDESMNFLETVLQEDGSFDEQEEINKYSAVLTKLCRGVPLFLDLSCKAMKQSKISCKEFCEKADPLGKYTTEFLLDVPDFKLGLSKFSDWGSHFRVSELIFATR